MWRWGGQLVVHAYHPDRPKSDGEDSPLTGTVPVGKWLQIAQRVKMNTGANPMVRDSRDGWKAARAVLSLSRPVCRGLLPSHHSVGR